VQAVHGDPILIARWLKFMKKGFTPVAGDAAEIGKALATLHGARAFEDVSLRARFLERSGLSAEEAVNVGAERGLSPAVLRDLLGLAAPAPGSGLPRQ
jgi:hypothetical protein